MSISSKDEQWQKMKSLLLDKYVDSSCDKENDIQSREILFSNIQQVLIQKSKAVKKMYYLTILIRIVVLVLVIVAVFLGYYCLAAEAVFMRSMQLPINALK